MIKENVRKLFDELPSGVQLVAATKSRSAAEILEAVEAGIKIIGENYVQEAEKKFKVVGRRVRWHFIGHLQRNKAKRAVEIFDMIETLDSFEIAGEIDKVCKTKDKVMPVLIEVNCAGEKQKFGVLPKEVEPLIKQLRQLKNVKILGLMTMGPLLKNPGELRSYFRETRRLFESIKSINFPGVEMRYLSMGMSDSYRIAIQEGANLVRIGTAIFGKRKT
jgi:hypothetical protein